MRAAPLALLLTGPAAAAPWGGDFVDFLKAIEAEVIAEAVPFGEFHGSQVDDDL